MRLLDRNKKTIYFKTFTKVEQNTDSNGLYTGEYSPTYSELQTIRVHVSPASGAAVQELFGIETNYALIILTEDMNCALDEYSIVWVDKDTAKGHNYVVARKSKGLNHIAYALNEVDHGDPPTQL